MVIYIIINKMQKDTFVYRRCLFYCLSFWNEAVRRSDRISYIVFFKTVILNEVQAFEYAYEIFFSFTVPHSTSEYEYTVLPKKFFSSGVIANRAG